MLDNETIDSYKALHMRSFLEFWEKICPDHTITIRDGFSGGSSLCIEIPDSFAERIRSKPKEESYRNAEVADRERILEAQTEHDELRSRASTGDY